MTSYELHWDMHRLVLPPPLDAEEFVEIASWGDAEDVLRTFCARALASNRVPTRPVTAEVELIHRPDNEYSRHAISVAIPSSGGGDADERHMGYLREGFLHRVGRSLLPDLATFFRARSGAGRSALLCTAVVLGADRLALDLPSGATLGKAVQDFLAAHYPDYVPAVQPPWDQRPGRFSPRDDYRHTERIVETDEALAWLSSFASPRRAVTALDIALVQGWRKGPRSLRLTDPLSGRAVGTVVAGHLLLDDERDRPEVLELLDEADVLVARPRSVVGAADDAWSGDAVPNMWTYWFPQGLDLRPRDPSTPNSWVSLAHFNPTTKTLWVQDSRLVGPARVYAARVGLQVDRVGLPRTAWALQDEVPYLELKDHSLAPGGGEDAFGVHLLEAVRDVVPDDLLPSSDEVTWVPSPAVPGHAEPDAVFRRHERHVRQRRALFGHHDLTTTISSCRLCGQAGLQFTTPICVAPLTYCHTCLHTAAAGLVRDRSRAAQALRLLGEIEFDNEPMLEGQLDALHVDPAEPATASVVDQLLLLRFAIARKQFAWTLLLEAAGFAKDGLRTSRGTLLRARDGHLCHSMREKAVCDFLHQHGVDHDREPVYPVDPDDNPTGRRRADWLLEDGTFIEFWGMPKDPLYAAKMDAKRRLAARYGVRLLELTDAELPRLPEVLAAWLPSQAKTTGRTTWSWSPTKPHQCAAPKPPQQPISNGRGSNSSNDSARQDRLTRAQEAVRLQRSGSARKDIATALGVSPQLVKELLRDGKFYADPAGDPARARLAQSAARARADGVTRAEFQIQHGCTALRAKVAWRDAGILDHPFVATGSGPRSGDPAPGAAAGLAGAERPDASG